MQKPLQAWRSQWRTHAASVHTITSINNGTVSPDTNVMGVAVLPSVSAMAFMIARLGPRALIVPFLSSWPEAMASRKRLREE